MAIKQLKKSHKEDKTIPFIKKVKRSIIEKKDIGEKKKRIERAIERLKKIMNDPEHRIRKRIYVNKEVEKLEKQYIDIINEYVKKERNIEKILEILGETEGLFIKYKKEQMFRDMLDDIIKRTDISEYDKGVFFFYTQKPEEIVEVVKNRKADDDFLIGLFNTITKKREKFGKKEAEFFKKLSLEILENIDKKDQNNIIDRLNLLKEMRISEWGLIKLFTIIFDIVKMKMPVPKETYELCKVYLNQKNGLYMKYLEKLGTKEKQIANKMVIEKWDDELNEIWKDINLERKETKKDRTKKAILEISELKYLKIATKVIEAGIDKKRATKIISKMTKIYKDLSYLRENAEREKLLRFIDQNILDTDKKADEFIEIINALMKEGTDENVVKMLPLLKKYKKALVKKIKDIDDRGIRIYLLNKFKKYGLMKKELIDLYEEYTLEIKKRRDKSLILDQACIQLDLSYLNAREGNIENSLHTMNQALKKILNMFKQRDIKNIKHNYPHINMSSSLEEIAFRTAAYMKKMAEHIIISDKKQDAKSVVMAHEIFKKYIKLSFLIEDVKKVNTMDKQVKTFFSNLDIVFDKKARIYSRRYEFSNLKPREYVSWIKNYLKINGKQELIFDFVKDVGKTNILIYEATNMGKYKELFEVLFEKQKFELIEYVLKKNKNKISKQTKMNVLKRLLENNKKHIVLDYMKYEGELVLELLEKEKPDLYFSILIQTKDIETMKKKIRKYSDTDEEKVIVLLKRIGELTNDEKYVSMYLANYYYEKKDYLKAHEYFDQLGKYKKALEMLNKAGEVEKANEYIRKIGYKKIFESE